MIYVVLCQTLPPAFSRNFPETISEISSSESSEVEEINCATVKFYFTKIRADILKFSL